MHIKYELRFLINIEVHILWFIQIIELMDFHMTSSSSGRRKRNMGRVRELEKLTKHYESTKITEKRPMDFSLKKTNDSGSNIIELKNVSFAYNSDLKKEIISNFNLKIQKKERLGIIGWRK